MNSLLLVDPLQETVWSFKRHKGKYFMLVLIKDALQNKYLSVFTTLRLSDLFLIDLKSLTS